MSADHDHENQLVLTLVQAMLGAVSPNMRAVSLWSKGWNVRLNFFLAEECREDREEIEDIVCEFEALQPRGLESLEVNVVVSREPWTDGVRSVPDRPVYVRRGM